MKILHCVKDDSYPRARAWSKLPTELNVLEKLIKIIVGTPFQGQGTIQIVGTK